MGQPPVPEAPPTRAAQVSALSSMDQLHMPPIPLSLAQLIQVCDEPRSSAPVPDASQVPHSVTKMAIPFCKAALPLSLSDYL